MQQPFSTGSFRRGSKVRESGVTAPQLMARLMRNGWEVALSTLCHKTTHCRFLATKQHMLHVMITFIIIIMIIVVAAASLEGTRWRKRAFASGRRGWSPGDSILNTQDGE